MSSYPFLFYGNKPLDWTDFGNYAVRFVDDNRDHATRAKIEDAAHTWATGVHWDAGGMAWFSVDSPNFGKATRGLRRVHRLSAIAEVVNHAALDISDHAWEKWTRKRQDRPSAELLDPDGVSIWSRDSPFWE